MLMPEVSRYMTNEPYTVPPTVSAAAAESVMQSHLIRHLPILDGDRLVGLVSAAELAALHTAPGVDLEKLPIAKVMTRPVTVWGAMPLDEVAERMSAEKVECVVVLGGHGVQGIFTASDALTALSQLLQRACG